MFHRLATRAAFWGTLTTLSLICSLAFAGGELAILFEPVARLLTLSGLMPSVEGLLQLGLAAPLLSALALLTAAAGWRILHREIALRDRHTGELTERANRLHEAMQASSDGVFILRSVRDALGVVTDFEIVDVNRTGARLLRADSASMLGTRLRADARGWLDDQHFEGYANAVALNESFVQEVRVNRRLFEAGWILEQVVPIADGLAVTICDITARKREERGLRRASSTDALTGLLNRRGFLTLAEQQARVARRQEKDFVLLYADMDRFKALNDEHGHAAGDRALEMVGKLLRRSVRECDLVARMGGDEFTIMAVDADHAAARLIQRRIETRMQELNGSGELAAPIALTIGHTRVRHTEGAPVPELLARADALLYSRKRRRKAAELAAEHAASRNEALRAIDVVPSALAPVSNRRVTVLSVGTTYAETTSHGGAPFTRTAAFAAATRARRDARCAACARRRTCAHEALDARLTGGPSRVEVVA